MGANVIGTSFLVSAIQTVYGADAATAANISTVNTVVVCIGCIVLPAVVARFKRSRPIFWVMLIGSGLFYMLALQVPYLGGAGPAIMFALGGIFFALYLIVLPFTADALFTGLSRLMGRPIPDNMRNMIFYYVLFALTVIIFWNYLGHVTGNFFSNFWRTIWTVCLGLVGFYGLNELSYRVLDTVLSGLTNLNDITISAQIHDAPRSTALIIIFLAPFVEEVLFRGLVFGNLKLKSRAVAYAVSCLLFALLHVWQFAVERQDITYFLMMVQYLVPGLVLAWAYDHSGSLWTSVGLHAAVNALATWAAWR